MYSLTKTQNFLFQLKDRLLENKKIKKLLYYTTPNALSLPDIADEHVKDMITLVPIIEDENGIAESYRNMFVAAYMADLIPSDTENDITIRIAVYANKDTYELDNQKLRPHVIMEEIFKEIRDVKFQFAGKMFPVNIVTENLIRGNFSGLISTWNVVDGNEII